MDSQRTSPPPPPPKPKFSVYQNPTLSAALTTRSLRPSPLSFLFLALSSLGSAASLLVISSREKQIAALFVRLHVSHDAASLLAKSLQAFVSLLLLAALSALLRALSRRHTDKALAAPSKNPAGQQSLLTSRQLQLVGLKLKSAESTHKPPKSTPVSPPSAPDGLVPVRSSGFSYVPSRPARAAPDHHGSGGGNKKGAAAVSPVTPPPPPTRFVASPSTPWSKQSPGTAKGILTEAMLEKYLAGVDGKIVESAGRDTTTTPPSKIRSFGVTSPGSVVTSATASGAARSTPLRPVRMSPGSHQKYTTPPKKGEGEFPPPMSMELAAEAFQSLGLHPNIEGMRDRLRQWFSSVLINPLCEKLESSHTQVMQAAAAVGISITVSPVGSEPVSTTVPAPLNGTKEWQPAVTVDEDGLLYQLRASLVQARDGVMPQLPLGGQQQLPQQNPLLPVIQQCVDAITEHQRLTTLMKGELIKGLLVHSSERAEYIVQRVRELSEGTCLKNYDYLGNGYGCDKSGKKRSSDLPTDSHLLLYLFCAFLEHPKWSLHVDPTSYSSAQSSKNPLFLGVLPPKDRFPEKYIAVISGVPSIIHPGACILSVGKQSPPIFALYWDKKLQFSLQGRTALWDTLLLLCHRINHAYGGVVRGVHLGSSALNILPVLDSNDES